jgi:hypothetical protein
VRHYAENVRLLSGLPYSTHDATDYGAGLLYLVMNELDGRSIMYPAAPFRLGLDRGPRPALLPRPAPGSLMAGPPCAINVPVFGILAPADQMMTMLVSNFEISSI